MAYYQQPKQDFAGISYFCCGNPFGDFFEAPSPTQNNVPQKQAQTLQWSDPFSNAYSACDERRHVDDDQDKNRAGEDARSVGTLRSTYTTSSRRSTHNAVSSNLDGKSLSDIEREDHARTRALRLQESLAGQMNREDRSMYYTSDTHTSVLATDRAAQKMARKQTQLRQPEVNAKSAAVNNAVRNLQKLQQDQKDVKKTETTRPKRELTAEDVRDPETIPGMKSNVDIKKEEEARTKSLQMISNGEFKFDPRAMIAFWSTPGSPISRKGKVKLNEIV